MKLFKQIYKDIILGIFLIILGCLFVYKLNVVSSFNIKNIRNYRNYVDGLKEDKTYTIKLNTSGEKLKLNKTEMYLNLYNGEVIVFKSVDPIYQDTDRNKFFKEKNIENDIDLFKYLLDTKDKKFNIFSSTNEMKNNYAIHYLVSNIYSNVESISFIEGSYDGYILNYNDHKEINIIKDNERYSLTINNKKYFEEEQLKKLLNTIEIM